MQRDQVGGSCSNPSEIRVWLGLWGSSGGGEEALNSGYI